MLRYIAVKKTVTASMFFSKHFILLPESRMSTGARSIIVCVSTHSYFYSLHKYDQHYSGKWSEYKATTLNELQLHIGLGLPLEIIWELLS